MLIYMKATEKEPMSLIQLLMKRMELSLSLNLLMELVTLTSSMSTRAPTTLTARNMLLITHMERMVELSSSIQETENTLLFTLAKLKDHILST